MDAVGVWVPPHRGLCESHCSSGRSILRLRALCWLWTGDVQRRPFSGRAAGDGVGVQSAGQCWHRAERLLQALLFLGAAWPVLGSETLPSVPGTRADLWGTEEYQTWGVSGRPSREGHTGMRVEWAVPLGHGPGLWIVRVGLLGKSGLQVCQPLCMSPCSWLLLPLGGQGQGKPQINEWWT